LQPCTFVGSVASPVVAGVSNAAGVVESHNRENVQHWLKKRKKEK
jgi:hypothetical protein